MAQTRKRRRRKHRGTQGGRVDSKPRGRPRNRAEAQQRARTKRKPSRGRGDLPPTWRSAILRGAVISALLIATLLVFGRPIAASIAFGVAMLGFYIPMGYYVDRFMWRRRQRQKMRDD
jgi:hypothetical protein